MSGLNRLHGRTPVQRYLCYHEFHNDSSYGNSVWNTTYNFNGGNICGGGFGGGFLGGIGFGIGAMVMKMLGNFNLGGFSSMSMNCGFPMFNFWNSPSLNGGGGFPQLNFWNSPRLDGGGGSEKPAAVAERPEAEKPAAKTTVTEAPAPVETKPAVEEVPADNTAKPEKVTTETKVEKPAPVVENKDAEVDVKNLSLKDTDAIIKNIDDIGKDDAIRILDDRCDAEAKTVKVPRNYAELLLAKKTGFTIKFCKNTGIRSGAINTIQGTIKGDISRNEEDNTAEFEVQDALDVHKLKMNFKNTTTEATTVTLVKEDNKTIKYGNTDLQIDKNRTYRVGNDDADYAIINNKKPAYYNPAR